MPNVKEYRRAVTYYSVHYAINSVDAMKRFYEDRIGAEEFAREVHGKVKTKFLGWKKVS